MKQTVSLILCSLAMGIAFPTSLHSQSAGGGAPAAKNSKSAAATRMDLVRIQSGSLKSAVAGLKEQVEAMNLPALNVIFGAATTDLQVPDLQLRHVAGADALRLLCASVDCEMEPIYSERQMVEGHMVEYVIGYQINARNPRPRINYTRATATTFGSMGGMPGTRSISKPKPPTQPGGLGLYGYSSSKRATKVSDGDSYAGGGGDDLGGGLDDGLDGVTIGKPRKKATLAGGGYEAGGGAGLSDFGGEGGMEGDMFDSGYSVKPTPITRIYALGRVTSNVKFEEVEKTLIAVLAAAGQKPDQAKISLHESTNAGGFPPGISAFRKAPRQSPRRRLVASGCAKPLAEPDHPLPQPLEDVLGAGVG